MLNRSFTYVNSFSARVYALSKRKILSRAKVSYRYTILLMVLFFMTGCSTLLQKKATVDVIVKDAQTLAPVQGALLEYKLSGSFMSLSKKKESNDKGRILLDVIFTDIGTYTITFPNYLSYEFRCSFTFFSKQCYPKYLTEIKNEKSSLNKELLFKW